MKEKYDSLSALCSRLTTRHYSTSFSLGIYYLDKSMRDPIYAIYGFVRLADEIVDSFHNYDKVSLLAKFKKDCYEALSLRISLNPVLHSFQKAVHDFNIGYDLIELFMNSMEMDLEEQLYTPENYERYILGSAQVVGLMCLHVFTNGDQDKFAMLKPSAMKLGSAFQKVNFLRDMNADFKLLNRTYFPGIQPESFTKHEKQQLEVEIETDFSEALEGIRALPKGARRGVYLAYVYYYQLFKKIKRTNAEKIMAERIRISNGYKCWLMIDSMLRYKMNAL